MANKKISELPLIVAISGSQVGGTILPVVLGGTTAQISAENFSKFVTAYSAHTGSAGNVFTGPQTINNNVTITGNEVVNGNVTISGTLTVYEVVAQYETSSILFSTGSTKLGDQITDRHEFTGSTNITGSLLVNGANLSDFSASNSTLFTTYSSSNATISENYSSSNAIISQNLSASNSTTFTNYSSSNAIISQTYSASNSTTFTNYSSSVSASVSSYSASNSTTFTNYSSSVSASVSSYSASNSTTFTNLSSSNSTTFTTYSSSLSSSISSYSASNSTTFTNYSSSNATISENYSSSNAVISQTISASNSTTFTNYSSSVSASISSYSASNSTTFTNFSSSNAVISQTYSASNSTTFTNYSSSNATISENYNSSDNTWKNGVRGEVSGIEAYTASLKSAIVVNGNNVTIIGELSASRIYTEYITSSVLFVTGSNRIGDQLTDKHEFTGSVAVSGKLYVNDSATNFLIEGNGFSQTYLTGNGTIVLNPGFGGVEMVGSYRTFKATDITADGFVSGEIRATNNVVSSSTQIQNYDVFALNSNLYNGTGSIKAEIAGIEAYTASLKGQAIVSSSQQIKNYIEFVNNSVTSSMNVNSASIAYKATNVVGSANRILFNNATDTTTTSANLQWDGSKLAVNGDISFGYASTLQSSLDPTNNISLHDGSFGEMRIRNGGTDRITLYRTTDTIKLSGSLVVDGNSLTAKHQITGSVEVNGSITGSILATNGVVSSSAQIQNYFTFAKTGSANTFYGNQSISGSLTVNSVGASGISINSNGDNPSLNLTQLAQANPSALNWRLISNYEGWGTLDIQSSADNATLPSTNTKVSITSAGDVNIKTGNLIMAKGKGIDFSATANSGSSTPSEILDDYEEGTWTPTIQGGTTPGTYTYEAARTGGRYVKVGKLVTVSGVVRIDTITSAGTGYLQIGGFPFVPSGKLAGSWGASSLQLFIYGAGVNSTATTYPPPFVINMSTGVTSADVGSRGKNYNIATVIGDLTGTSWIYEIEGSYMV